MKKKSASQSAFFKFRIVLGVLLCFGAITLVLLALGKVSAQPQTSLGQSGNSQQPIYTAPQVQRQNPYSDAWLAANHGKYDNIWTAEYETRLQQAAEPSLSDLLSVLTPQLRRRRAHKQRQRARQRPERIPDRRQPHQQPQRHRHLQRRPNGRRRHLPYHRRRLTWTSADASFYGVQAACCDPGVAYGSDGSVYAIILDTSPAATYIIKSTDGGATWAPHLRLHPRPAERCGGPKQRQHRLHHLHRLQPAGRAASTATSPPTAARPGARSSLSATRSRPPGYQQSSQPRVASNGWIYVGYQEYNDQTGCAAGVRNEVARSTDGGATWTVPPTESSRAGRVRAQAGRGIFCINAGGASFRSRSHPIMGISPTDPSHVYMVYSGGDLESAYTCGGSTGFHSDTLFRRSTDGGVTWTAPAKINTDPQGKDQYYPWMSVLPNGQIWVGWNDRRDDANNFLSKWYQAHSNDEGTTWLDINNAPGNDVVADVQTQPSTFIGDYHGLGASGNGVGNVLGMWFDSRNSSAGDAYTDPQVPPPIGFSVT